MSHSPIEARLFAPAIARNRDPILDTLRPLLPESGLVLEIASGTGEHIVHFAQHVPHLVWQPSDPSSEARASIEAWSRAEKTGNVRRPLDLDASAAYWPIQQADAIICINMLHISPWAATEGLMRGAAAILGAGGLLYIYGPFRVAGVETAPSNEAFDSNLRMRNAEWGLRDLEAVTSCATAHGLALVQTIAMPANNLSVIFRKS